MVLLVVISSCRNSVPADSESLLSWGTARLIEKNDNGDIDAYQIAVDGKGNAIVVWSQYDDDRYCIYASHFNGSDWSSAELIDSDDDGNAYTPRIVMNGNGEAVAVWSQYEENQFSIFANYFDGSEWDSAELVYSSDYDDAIAPRIAMDGNGNVLAVWQQYDENRYSICAGYYNGTKWSAAELIEFDDSGDTYEPRIATDNSGNAVAVWRQYDGSLYRMYAGYFNGASWGAPELIDAGCNGDADHPELSMNDVGGAVAVWRQYDGDRYCIYANSFDGAAWNAAELIDSAGAGDSNLPEVSMDNTGNAVAVWQKYDGTRFGIYTNCFNGVSWSVAGAMDDVYGGNAFYPDVAMDGNGNAIAVWSQFDSFRYGIRANFFDGASWHTVESIDYEDGGSAYYPGIVIDGTGNAIAVWPQYDGVRFSLYANHGKIPVE